MWESIRGYLTFTKKERYGVLFLLVIISVLFVLPYFFRPAVGDPDPGAYQKMKGEIRKFESQLADSSRGPVQYDRFQDHRSPANQTYADNSNMPISEEMFHFDPNTLNADLCRRLGLPERLAQTILHYIEKGGRFRRTEDLKKVYGLSNSDYERLFPYVRIARGPEDFHKPFGYNKKTSYSLHGLKKADSFFREGSLKTTGNGFIYERKKFEFIDINRADSADWSRLPGIGAKLASRIVHFREKLGGFYQVGQVSETFALPDSVFQKIKPYLQLHSMSLRQIDLNSAAREAFEAHPYIRWELAKRIIDYRRQHCVFHSVEELLQLGSMDPLKFEKLKPYLFVKSQE
jgi:competence protein ComEA